MENENNHIKLYVEKYTPIISEFFDSTKQESFTSNGLVAPHLPACGPSYGQLCPKIAIIGEETRGWRDFESFITKAEKNPEKLVNDYDLIYSNYTFTKWTNNFGRTFWDTAFKILAHIHDEPNWKNLKNKTRTDILDSILWCNVNSIEGFNISAKTQGADKESWDIVKNSSVNLFDKYKLIKETFSPDISIIMNWDTSNSFFQNVHIQWNALSDYLNIGNLEDGSIIYHTAHPSWLNKKKKYDRIINLLLTDISDKKLLTLRK